MANWQSEHEFKRIMDKEFLAIIALMLLVCTIIVLKAGLVPVAEKENAAVFSEKVDTSYVEQLFDKESVIDIYITLAEADFQDMLANPIKEEYKEATIIVNGQKAEHVGYRIKGNSSLSSVARTTSDRYSFKVDIDRYINGQNLLGLTKLNLNNSFSDPSFMREYLSYSLLNEMGIPTPAYGYANIYVNGELWGLYLAVEGLEEPFLERYYGSSYGSLYKSEGGQGSDLLFTDDKRSSYKGLALKTDQKDGADEALLAMLKALNQGKELEQYLNIDEILRYFAVNTVLVNMDSYLGNFKHNYYLYEEKGVFSILPWDYNMSFGGFGMGGSQSSTSLHIDAPVTGTTLAQRPLLGKLLEVQEYKDSYHEYIQEFLAGPFSQEKMEAEIERIAAMIRTHVEKDPTKFYTMEQFEQAISEGGSVQVENKVPVEHMQGTSPGLHKFIRERNDVITKQLNGEIIPETERAMGNMKRERPDNQQGAQRMPPDRAQMIPPDRSRMRPPDRDRQIYLAGGAILLLVIALFLIRKRKTKYTV